MVETYEVRPVISYEEERDKFYSLCAKEGEPVKFFDESKALEHGYLALQLGINSPDESYRKLMRDVRISIDALRRSLPYLNRSLNQANAEVVTLEMIMAMRDMSR